MMRHREELSGTLPKCDYYERSANYVEDPTLANLVSRGQVKLRQIVATVISDIDLRSRDAINRRVEQIKDEIKRTSPGTPNRKLAEQQLEILQDLIKLESIKRIKIPQDDGSSLDYITMAEVTAGVTQKIALVSGDTAIQRLTNLADSPITSLANYSEQRSAQFKLKTDAILKLPKHGNIKEVLREQLALNTSRMLGLQTTKSTMVGYAGKPALLVPFDDIRILGDATSGITKRAVSVNLKKYVDHSIMNSFGEGLHPDRVTADFASAIGLIYVAGDPDSIGGTVQNKALKDGKLYVFDQVLSDGGGISIDSHFNLRVTGWHDYSRHTSLRNKEVINDSSLEGSYDALMQLKGKRDELTQYFDVVVNQYAERIVFLNSNMEQLNNVIPRLNEALNRTTSLDASARLKLDIVKCEEMLADMKKQVGDLGKLSDDVEALKIAVVRRIESIDSIIPKTGANVDPGLVLPVLTLELLGHHPRLYTEDGRPYRYPWADPSSNRVISIMQVARDSARVNVKFADQISVEHFEAMKYCLGPDADIRVNANGTKINMSKSDLSLVSESKLFPELQTKFDPHLDYLDPRDVKQISLAYKKGNQGEICGTIDIYSRKLIKIGGNTEARLKLMEATETELKTCIATAEDKGFGKHVLKRFQFDAQQQLQMMMSPEQRADQLNEAFNAAIKLDRMGQFNAVVKEAVRSDTLSEPVFTEFLESCIRLGEQALDHFSSKSMSLELERVALGTVVSLSEGRLQAMAAASGEADEDVVDDDFLVLPDPIEDTRRRLDSAREVWQIAHSEVAESDVFNEVKPGTVLPIEAGGPGKR